jgi:hypothetical protein
MQVCLDGVKKWRGNIHVKGILFTLQISKKMFGNGPTFKEQIIYILM